MEGGRTAVAQGKKHQRTGDVSKLCVKTSFISENFHS